MNFNVALFARAWIEIPIHEKTFNAKLVALFARAWIEMPMPISKHGEALVALFARAWIEISCSSDYTGCFCSRPLYEGVD